MLRKTVEVSPDRTRYTVTSVRVDERSGEQCPRCGAELWTRDGEGRYTLVMLLAGAPVLELHGALSCPGWWDAE